MFNLKEEVIHHALGESFTMIGFKTKQDEITVPSVHFIETSARHNIEIRQIEQARSG